MNERRFNGKVERLRSAERLSRMEVNKAIDLCLDGIEVSNVLDIGTGSGLFAEGFYNRGLKVWGVDVNPEMVEAAKSYVPNGEFTVSTAEDIPFEDKSFDLVFLGHVLHEVDDYLQTLKQTRRVSKKRVCIFEWQYKQQEFGPPLHHRLKPDEVLLYANQAGFTDCWTIELGHMLLYVFQ